MSSSLYRQAKTQALGRELRRALGSRYARREAEQSAIVLESGQLKIGGQRYPATGVGAAAGQTVTVQNIGRAGNATYAPAVGTVTISSGGRASGAGASGATTFDALTDTPSSKSGHNDKFLRVDSSATGITYGTIGADDLTISDWVDTNYGLTTSSNKIRVSLAGTSALEFTGGALRLKGATAGAGLTMASQILAVGAGDGISVSADAVAVDAASIIDSAYGLTTSGNDIRVSLAGTSGLEFSGGGLQLQDALAGDGLTIAGKVLAVGAGDGLDVSADALAVDVTDIIGAGLTEDGSNNLALQTPGIVAVDSVNSAEGNHTHAVTSSSDPGAAASLLATNAAGQLTVEILRARDHIEAADTGRPAVKIRRLSGQSAYLWRVEDESQTGLLGVSAEGDLESLNPGFTSGIAGWQIQADGSAEFNNIRVRGELHATTFVADEMHALGGTFVALTATTTSAPAYTGGNPGDTISAYSWHPVSGPITYPTAIAIDGFTLPVAASYDTGLCYFADGDILRIKSLTEIRGGGNLDLLDIYLEVDGAPSSNGDRDMAAGNPGTYNVPVVLRYPTSGASNLTIPAGASVVKWGENSGSGYTGGLLFTSDLADAPYMDIFTVDSSGAAWPPAVTPRVRVGNLDGVLGLGEQWGIAAGADLTDTGPNAAYMVLSDQQQTTNNITSRWKSSGVTWAEFDPSGLRAKFGTNTAAAGTTLFDLNVGAGTLAIGNSTSPAAVTVTGTINIQNPGDLNTGDLNNDAGWTDTTTYYAASGSPPASPSAGDLWYQTDTYLLLRWSGAAWVTVGNAYSNTNQLTDGAGLGNTALWGSLSGVPARFGNAPSGTGLFLTATHMGYYDSAAWKTYMDSGGNFYLSGSGSHALTWNGSTLAIAGNITVLGGDAATQSYADDAATTAADAAQSAAEAYAASQASAAQTAAQSYGSKRRVLALAGTWTSTDADTISWTSASVRLGDGATYSLSDGNTGNMAGLSYLYVDVTASTPWTVGVATSLATLGVNHAVIAIAQPGTISASVRSAAGVTNISGDQILTGTITANEIKAGTITGTQISSDTSITAGSDNNVGVLSGSDATYRIWAGHANPASAPFAVSRTGGLTATSANITGNIVATSGTFSNVSVAGSIAVGAGGYLYSGISSWGSGTGYYLDYNGGTPRFVVGVQSGGLLSRGVQWDGADLSIRMRDGSLASLYMGDATQDGFLDIDMRQGSGASQYDYGIHISDGGNTSAGVSALYSGFSDRGATAVDRIFDAYTTDASSVADGFYADMAGGNYAAVSQSPTNGNGIKAFQRGNGVSAHLEKPVGSSSSVPVVWATHGAGGPIYHAQVSANSQTAFKIYNAAGATDFTALQAANGNVKKVTYIMLKEISDGDVPNPDSGYVTYYHDTVRGFSRKHSNGTTVRIS